MDQPDAPRPGDSGLHRRGDRAGGAARCQVAGAAELDGGMPFDAFLALWARTTRDRDLVPEGGHSSRQAAARLLTFLADLRALPGPVAAVTHGGITTELLRDPLGDDALRPGVLDAGIPPCAITAIDDLNPVMIASVSHLA